MNFHDLFRDWKDTQDYPAQTVLFTAGAPADVMYLVLSGEVELTLHGDLLSTESEGGIIGEMALVSSATRNSTAITIGQVKLARLDRGQLEKLIAKDSAFSMHVMAVLANRLQAVDNFISARIEST
jgi:CRP/FNR family cyclic AMP-dependent transcriptional regulator